jgi:hypothetical protein
MKLKGHVINVVENKVLYRIFWENLSKKGNLEVPEKILK